MQKPNTTLSTDVANWLFDVVDKTQYDGSDNAFFVMRKEAIVQLALMMAAQSDEADKKEEKISASVQTPPWGDAALLTDKVSTIKLIRSLTGLGLKEAKDMSELPHFSLKMTAAQAEVFMKCGCQVTFPTPVTIAPAPNVVKRSVYLVFNDKSATVLAKAKHPMVGAGEVALRLDVSLPGSLFSAIQLRAQVDIPESAGISPEALVDLKQALGMSYGKSVQLIVEPANGTSSSENSS